MRIIVTMGDSAVYVGEMSKKKSEVSFGVIMGSAYLQSLNYFMKKVTG